jgi:hypothetical protein
MLQTLAQTPGQSHQLGAVGFRLYFAVQVLRGWVQIWCYERLGGHAMYLIALAARLAVQVLAPTFCLKRG